MLNDTNRILPIKNIKIKDDFWSRYVDLAMDVVIPYQWEALGMGILLYR